MDRELPTKVWDYLREKQRENISTHRMKQWGEDSRIVNKIYDLMGFQNGSTTLKESLQEIAEYISHQEGRKFSVEDVKGIYKRVTSGSLASEVKFAKKFPYEWIQKQREKIRKSNVLSRGFHAGDAREQLTESEKEGFYELEKRLRMGS